jgi:AraC-like DNA-binding protein
MGAHDRVLRPGEATVSTAGIFGIPAVLRSLGADPDEVLAEVGVDPRLFDDPTNSISYVTVGRLVSHCVARTGCRHFGLLVGQQGGPDSVGLLGVLLHYSADVGTALRGLVSHLHLQVRGADVGLEVTGGTAALMYDTHEQGVEAADQINDGAIAIMFNIMRAMCGSEWRPSAILLAHRKPEDVRPFRALFRAPLFFDAEHNALEFPANWLRYPLPNADAMAHLVVERQIDELEAKYRDNFVERVREVLRHALLTGHGTATQVASLFSMHSRTLNRHLNACGTGFQDLVDEVRFEIARQALQFTSKDVVQIAAALDYADSSAFTRAFRRWSGTTPARWRAQARLERPRGESIRSSHPA